MFRYNRMLAFFKKTKILNINQHTSIRLSIILCGFIAIIILRQIFHAFDISLGYLYITIIAISGLWFGIKGGILAATIALAIFIIELHVFNTWPARDIVEKTIILRIGIYFFSGILIGWQSDIGRKLREKLEFLASYDELTEIINFRSSINLLEKKLEYCKKYKKNLTVAIIDIDHFKEINDTYGHLVGNDLLQQFAMIIRNNLREIDTVGRYGGDEFILIFPECKVEHGAAILTKIRNQMHSTKIISSWLMDKKLLSLTFSAGVSAYNLQDISINELINNADKALYRAKKEGKNKVVVY